LPTAPPTSVASRTASRLATLPTPILFALFFLAITLTHLTLLRLPYYWDEGGYYIPAALDFYRRFTLIPEFTNAHPPLPNIILGTLWHLTGLSILATRLTVCAFAAAALTAVFRLTQSLLSPTAAFAVTFLTAAYPIWFAQSTLAHADIFAATFTLWAFALYFGEVCHPERSEEPASSSKPTNDRYLDPRPQAAVERPPHLPLARAAAIATLFSLAALSKETAIVEPAILAALHLFLFVRNPTQRRTNLRWLITLSTPLLPLIAWYIYHHHKTGFTFGNPEYLRYNATANLTASHIVTSIYYRAIHLFWQRNIWLPILFALACLLLPERNPAPRTPTPFSLLPIPCLILGNWMAFSILGGALLTRYLLPIYPLILILCVAIWRAHTRHWPWFFLATAAAFISAIWLNPPTAFAPEDNLTYRDMIVVHQQAAAFIEQHYPNATVLTAWPAAAELFKPDLGYVSHPFKVIPLENFTAAELYKTAQHPGDFDTALIFPQHYNSPALQRYLLAHPTTRRGREFAEDRDLTPKEVARILGGTIVFEQDRGGEWAAVLRFNRSYEAQLHRP
jgi:4-amino-4-deoxy-L-arabinose transferase-like glycosyltransferase